MFKRVGLFFCGLSMVAALTSCGEEELGGGIGEFTTVSASATADTGRFESDLLTGNTCSAGVSSGGNFGTDVVDVAFTSTALFTPGALNLLIRGVTIRYTPVNPPISTSTPPPLPDYPWNFSTQVEPGESITIPVPVLPEVYKNALATRATQNLQACGGDLYEYFVQVIFHVSEPGGNGKERDVIANLNIAIADRN